MDIQRINTYTDPRFPQEVLYQHGAFLVDGKPWSFRVISDHAAVVQAEALDETVLAEAVEDFRFYAEHITAFYDEAGTCLLRLPPVERREAEIDSLQPSQFSVDREKCAAVGHFIRTSADVVVPVTALKDGALCVLDGHTRLYEAWRQASAQRWYLMFPVGKSLKILPRKPGSETSSTSGIWPFTVPRNRRKSGTTGATPISRPGTSQRRSKHDPCYYRSNPRRRAGRPVRR